MLIELFLAGFFSGIYILPFSLIRYFAPAHAQATSMGFINMMQMIVGATVLQPFMGELLSWSAHGGQLTVPDFRIALNMLLLCFMIALLFVLSLRMPGSGYSRQMIVETNEA